MRRALSVWFHSLSIDLTLHARRGGGERGESGQDDPGRAILLVEPRAGRTLVARCSSSAHESGVRPGLPLAEARSLLSPREPVVESFSRERELRALRALGDWAMRFSPTVALDPPDGLWLDVGGFERLVDSEDALLEAVQGMNSRRFEPSRTVVIEW